MLITSNSKNKKETIHTPQGDENNSCIKRTRGWKWKQFTPRKGTKTSSSRYSKKSLPKQFTPRKGTKTGLPSYRWRSCTSETIHTPQGDENGTRSDISSEFAETIHTPQGDENSRVDASGDFDAKQFTPRKGTKTPYACSRRSRTPSKQFTPRKGTKTIPEFDQRNHQAETIHTPQGDENFLYSSLPLSEIETIRTPQGDENGVR